jgi:tRNA threonylcarbamoyl adenosine modification protein (Sua5/YciO/YrdC/YwlC family)
MQEIQLTKENHVEALQAALEVVNQGGTVVYPTETSYGLGCDFFNKKAIAKIYKIKKREENKPLSVIVPDIISASYLVVFSDKARRLALSHWPGPLTLVLPYKYCEWNDHCDDFLALRVSSHRFADSLANGLGNPIVSTSANLSDATDSYSPEDIKKQFEGSKYQPDLFINAGQLEKNKPSTIVKCDKDQVEILRQGDLQIKI